ncbi:MAG: YceI family protein [Pseudomonadota bacterium]
MLKKILTTAALVLAATGVVADGWTLDNDASRIQFGSIKKDYVGESHHFTDVSGNVSEAGNVAISIDLTSVETWIDIRNERMIEHVFGDVATATLAATLDMDAMNALAPGDSMIAEVDGTLTLLGIETEVFTEFFVMRVADDKVLVTTNDMIFLRADDAGLDGGLDTLMGLANLSGITRASPVSLRLVFDRT